MTSSLVGSEMCIRDRGCTLSPLLFIVQLSIVMDRVQEQLLHEIPLALTPCLLYTSDAADDM
eukprot:6465876-Prorocentrum_lima.AAC.1